MNTQICTISQVYKATYKELHVPGVSTKSSTYLDVHVQATYLIIEGRYGAVVCDSGTSVIRENSTGTLAVYNLQVVRETAGEYEH